MMLILKSWLLSLVLNRVAKCAISEESFLPGRACLPIRLYARVYLECRSSIKKQKQNRETKKKSKRYIRDNRVNTGAANGSVPQNICSSGQVLLVGRCGRNDMSLEGKC